MIKPNLNQIFKSSFITTIILFIGVQCLIYDNKFSVIDFVLPTPKKIRGGLSSENEKCGKLFISGTFTKANKVNACQEWDYKIRNTSCVMTWQPDRCSMHYYSIREARKCFEKLKSSENKSEIVVIGDSRNYFFYLSLTKMLGVVEEDLGPARFEANRVRHDLIASDNKLNFTLKYYWRTDLSHDTLDLVHNIQEKSLISLVIGTALHQVKRNNGSLEGLELYRTHVEGLKQVLDRIGEVSPTVWRIQPTYNLDVPLILPFVQPDYLELHNKIAQEVFSNTSVILWLSSKQQAELRLSSYKDYNHVSNATDYIDVQMFLNRLCNKRMHLNKNHCCVGT